MAVVWRQDVERENCHDVPVGDSRVAGCGGEVGCVRPRSAAYHGDVVHTNHQRVGTADTLDRSTWRSLQRCHQQALAQALCRCGFGIQVAAQVPSRARRLRLTAGAENGRLQSSQYEPNAQGHSYHREIRERIAGLGLSPAGQLPDDSELAALLRSLSNAELSQAPVIVAERLAR